MTFARDRKAKHTAMREVRIEVFMPKDCTVDNDRGNVAVVGVVGEKH